MLFVTVLFVYEISREPLNGFAPNSQGKRVWSLAGTSLKVDQGQFRWSACYLCLENIFALVCLGFLVQCGSLSWLSVSFRVPVNIAHRIISFNFTEL